MSASHHLLRLQCVRCVSHFLGTPVRQVILPGRAHLQTPGSQHIYVQLLRPFHRSAVCSTDRQNRTDIEKLVEDETHHKDKTLVTHDDIFDRAAGDSKTKVEFNRVVDVFKSKDIRRRGHVEFIYAALKKMPEFGVECDVTVYNKLLDVFPKEVFVPQNFIQRMFNHYPRQQECGVQVLEQMENYGVMPNIETKVLLVQIFGEKSHPIRKFQRIMYWFPKFKHTNPYPVPHVLPSDPVDLAQFSLTRIAADLDAKITIYQYPSTDITETGEEITRPHIVGIQSPDQRSLLAKHNPCKPVFVEGPYPLWLRQKCVHYYLLRADPIPPEEKVEEEIDPEMICPEQSLFFPQRVELDLNVDMGDDHSFNVDEVEEGAVYAMCMAGQGDQATLSQWISGLQETCPILGQIPTVFRLESGPRELQTSTDAHQRPEQEAETDQIIEDDEEPRHSRGVKQ
ncbi:evolutionarily conserved signaling intermediate in Toll pathway, mitochondrial [Danio rerio]|uniref:Evolutionarily conserved signaling intermediate in Toll pathway, mitochondrial n=1 Tax=Danio rerio TaxID=7955 RepID=F1QSV0_DANRE|nr:evolutionarily conserved signaling intermediate in Toll pathway, mitochondrial [Danio rerio]XP_009301272.1 evolutionarily conserved signaling intermediate in Toll pathway, mitochondrial isoform X1 [Danio rerio]|eukprot:NP_001229867.1 evolutionarily conserved signaling intermediate in Toll pathway, mitochondrial [Danio rerio]